MGYGSGLAAEDEVAFQRLGDLIHLYSGQWIRTTPLRIKIVQGHDEDTGSFPD